MYHIVCSFTAQRDVYCLGSHLATFKRIANQAANQTANQAANSFSIEFPLNIQNTIIIHYEKTC